MSDLGLAIDSPSLAASFAALNRAHGRDDLITAVHHALQHHAQTDAIQITWLEHDQAAVLLPTPLLPPPAAATRDALATGDMVQRGALIFLPMLVGGTLRGWTTLCGARSVDEARLLTDHAGALLALVDQTAAVPQPSVAPLKERDRQLAVLDEITNQLRAATDVDHISTIVADAVRSLTNTPRMLVYLIDPQREWATLHYQEGLDDASLAHARIPAMRVGDGQHMLAQRFEALGKHVYRARQRLPESPFEENALLLLSDQQHAPVGAVIFDLVNYGEPFDAAFMQTLEVLANGAASALRTTWLIDEQQRTVDRLVALNAFSLAATNTALAPAELLRITVAGAVGTTQGICGGALVEHAPTSMCLCECPAAATCAAAIETHLAAHEHTAAPIEWENDAVPEPARAAGVGSVICVPLRGTTSTMGHLWVAHGSPVVLPATREMVVLYAQMAGAVLENERLVAQLRTAHDRFAAIIAALDEGMLMVTGDGEILVANAALHRLLDVPQPVLVGTPLFALQQQIAQHHDDPHGIAQALHAVAQGERTAATGELQRTKPAQRSLAWRAVPIQSADTPGGAALLLLCDVTAERQASKLRHDLTHMLVHDLRAPLANMSASLDLLLKQRVGPLTPRQARITQIASDGSQHMAALVDALLDTKRLERWQWDMHKEVCSVYPLVQAACEQAEQAAGARGVTFHNGTATLPLMQIDRDLVRRVLQNVLDNAVKFSGDNGTVHISGTVLDTALLPANHSTGQWACISVTDNGPGVPFAYHAHIFELFGQARNARQRGSGVGLAFCKLAVEAHGGMIWVEDAPDGGATFLFTLPLA